MSTLEAFTVVPPMAYVLACMELPACYTPDKPTKAGVRWFRTHNNPVVGHDWYPSGDVILPPDATREQIIEAFRINCDAWGTSK